MTSTHRRANNGHHHSKKKKSAEHKNKQIENNKSKTNEDTNPPQECLLDKILRRPLLSAALTVLLPYGLYIYYRVLILQRPDLVAKFTFGKIVLRPAVRDEDERQMLIVGTMSSGTFQMATSLKSLDLEIGHEDSNAKWGFVRDGTVSWFHGIRFIPRPENTEDVVKSVGSICAEETRNMGFHPAMYQGSHQCKYNSKNWDGCWRMECIKIITKEWGCAIRSDCKMPFRKNVLQVRDPMRVIESLIVKFCDNSAYGDDSLNGQMHPSFLKYVNAIFGVWHDFTLDSCVEASGYYVVAYVNAMLKAIERGEISSFYKIEKSNVCDVAEASGLWILDDTVYRPNFDKITLHCGKAEFMKFVQRKENRINKGKVKIGWSDLRGGMHGSIRDSGNSNLENMVKELYLKLGYDPTREVDVVEGVCKE